MGDPTANSLLRLVHSQMAELRIAIMFEYLSKYTYINIKIKTNIV